MSRGLGRIQRECLRVISDAAGKKLTTYTVAAEVYRVERNADGGRTINDAQHVATKRALASLRRAGLVTGQQDISGDKTGEWWLASCQRANWLRAERCCLWSINVPQQKEVAAMAASQ